MNGGDPAEISLLSWFLMILIGTLIIGGIFGLFWWFGMPYGVHRGASQRRKAMRILDERYARGEIPQAEYDRQRRELETRPPPA